MYLLYFSGDSLDILLRCSAIPAAPRYSCSVIAALGIDSATLSLREFMIQLGQFIPILGEGCLEALRCAVGGCTGGLQPEQHPVSLTGPSLVFG